MDRIYNKNTKQGFLLLILAAVMSFALCLPAGAQESNIEPGLRDEYNKLCEAFNRLSNKDKKKVPGACTQSYVKKRDQDKAVEKICDKFGASTLKSQCKAYNNYVPGSGRQAESGGSVVQPKRDPALDCINNRDKCDLIGKYVNPMIGFLSAFVGIAVTIGIISGGIRYASSEGDPQKATAAKKQITTAIVALFAYLFLYLILRWLSPQL